MKRFLDTDFTTKNYSRALNLRLGYKFHHLIKTKTHLNTTLIGLIRDKQVENFKVTHTEEFITHNWFQFLNNHYKRDAHPTYKARPALSLVTR